MISFCSLSEHAPPLDDRKIFDTTVPFRLPVHLIWQILDCLNPLDNIDEEAHFCSPLYPCRLTFPVMRDFLQLRLVCRTFDLMCQMLWPEDTRSECWAEPIAEPGPIAWGTCLETLDRVQALVREISGLLDVTGIR